MCTLLRLWQLDNVIELPRDCDSLRSSNIWLLGVTSFRLIAVYRLCVITADGWLVHFSICITDKPFKSIIWTLMFVIFFILVNQLGLIDLCLY